MIKHLDLFAGIGGFSLALQRVVRETEGGFSEIDKYATQIYKKHFPGHTEYGDITAIRERELPSFDLITFGFPCQDLSIAGKRKGFDGHRSSLFHEAIRIINEVRPKYFIFENVKGLYSSRKGEDFITVLQTITDIGYSGQWQLLNTKWFLPQNRERIYFIGHLRGEPRPEVFPIGEDDKIFNELRKRFQGQIQPEGWNGESGLSDKPIPQTRENGHLHQIGNIDTKGHNSLWGRVYDPEGIATNINSNGGGLGAKTGLYMVNDPSRKQGIIQNDLSPTLRSEAHGNLPCIAYPLTECRTEEAKETRRESRKSGKDFSPRRGKELQIREDGVMNNITATPTVEQTMITNGGIRRLTPTECERLQGYPDGYTGGISDTQRYKTLGNSITVNVAEAIFRKLFNN